MTKIMVEIQTGQVMTNSLCLVCKENPKDFVILDQVLVVCVQCDNKLSKREGVNV